MFNKKGIIWYLVEREGIFFMIGLVVGLVFMILWAMKIIPIPFDICNLF